MKYFSIRKFTKLQLAIGRLGMKLVQLGYQLQRDYGQWNDDFRLKFEIRENSKYGRFHLSDPVIDSQALTFQSPQTQTDKMPGYVVEIFDVDGVETVKLTRYAIEIKKAEVYEWNEIRPQVEDILIGQFAYRLQHKIGSQPDDIEIEFRDYAGSNLGRFDLSTRIVRDGVHEFRPPATDRENVPKFVRRLFEIDGITRVAIQQYQIRINKGELFEWKDIREDAETILREELTA